MRPISLAGCSGPDGSIPLAPRLASRRHLGDYCFVHILRDKMTTVSPFARSSVFDDARLGGREQTVSSRSADYLNDEP